MVFDPSSLTLIFTAGSLTLLSPCGFPMLPGYVSYYIGTKASVEKAVPAGIACTLGLLTVFSVIGVAVSVLGSLISRFIPLLDLIAGLLMIFMGIGIIAGVKLSAFFQAFTGLKAPRRRGLVGIFVYGIVYGLATFGCSAPIVISIFFYAVAAGGFFYGMITFIVYALGMGLPIVATTILIAKAKKLTLEKIVRLTPWFQRFSGVILIIIGAYLIYFYLTSLPV